MLLESFGVDVTSAVRIEGVWFGSAPWGPCRLWTHAAGFRV